MSKTYRQVGQPIPKKDSKALTQGLPVYLDDVVREGLVVKLLRSPHAHADIISINIEEAMKIDGMECILTHEDVPENRFVIAGQAYPEWSPYDRRILDSRVRYVGDPVAIVAGETEEAVDTAMKKIKVEYKVLPAILDLHNSMDSETLIHPEDNWETKVDFGGDNKRNLCAAFDEEGGDPDGAMASCQHTFEGTYRTQQASQCMMETHRTASYMDHQGRLNVVSSTQIPFHVRRILATALNIPKSKIRVIKPRIGGGFGAKQSAVCEMYPAAVTWYTGKAAKLIYTRQEVFEAGSPRHEMEITVKVGADSDGIIRTIDMFTLSNTGAYGEHGPTTVGLSGHQTISLYRYAKDYRFNSRVVYTNTVPPGAYRGFGATQGCFALESAVNELARDMGMDPLEIRRKNQLRQGDVMYAFGEEIADSCTLPECTERAAELFDWNAKSARRIMPNGKIRAGGMAMTMQDSGIKFSDTATASVKLLEDGAYFLSIGSTEMGMGCDTILAQIAAETLECSTDNISTLGVDTDNSAYDTGSYASSTTYVTGQAIVKACEELKSRMIGFAGELLGCNSDELEFLGDRIATTATKADSKEITLTDLYYEAINGHAPVLEGKCANTQTVAPPPFVVGMAEVEVDPETGSVEVTDFVQVIDCGTVINPNLAKIQAEGGALQGIGMALTEDVRFDSKGKMITNSYLNYGIPSRLECRSIRTDFCESNVETGPYGAKSLGEVILNSAAPAIADAVYAATGKRIRRLPITPEKILL